MRTKAEKRNWFIILAWRVWGGRKKVVQTEIDRERRSDSREI